MPEIIHVNAHIFQQPLILNMANNPLVSLCFTLSSQLQIFLENPLIYLLGVGVGAKIKISN